MLFVRTQLTHQDGAALELMGTWGGRVGGTAGVGQPRGESAHISILHPPSVVKPSGRLQGT